MNRVSSAPGLRAKIWGARLGRGTWKLSRFILLLGIQFVLIYPILYMVITAFRGRADMEDPSVVWLTRTWTLDNMALLVKTMNYPALLGYTAEISFVSAFLLTFVCGVVGYGSIVSFLLNGPIIQATAKFVNKHFLVKVGLGDERNLFLKDKDKESAAAQPVGE